MKRVILRFATGVLLVMCGWWLGHNGKSAWVALVPFLIGYAIGACVKSLAAHRQDGQ